MTTAERVQVLLKHLLVEDRVQPGLVPSPTAARGGPALPRFDANVMENYLDDLASLKEEVYSVFEHKPHLLPTSLEGLSKGTPVLWRLCACCAAQVADCGSGQCCPSLPAVEFPAQP